VLTVVGLFQLDRGNVAAGFVETAVVESVDVLEGRDFYLLDGSPGPPGVDQLGFEQADDGLGEAVVEGSRRGCRSMVRHRFRRCVR
jgi:hypothetical protein